MTVYLNSKTIKDETKDALTRHGFDTLESLEFMTETDIGTLNVVTGQARMLKAAINELQRTKLESEPSEGNSKLLTSYCLICLCF